jgi:hypothetical protein
VVSVSYKFNDDKDFTSKKVQKKNFQLYVIVKQNQNKRLSFFNLSFSTLCYCQTKYCKWIANLPYYVVNNCESDYYRIFFNRLFSGICLLLHPSFIFGRESV